MALAENIDLAHALADFGRQLAESDAYLTRDGIGKDAALGALTFHNAFEGSNGRHAATTAKKQRHTAFAYGKCEDAIGGRGIGPLQSGDTKGEGDRLEARCFENLFEPDQVIARDRYERGELLIRG